jgi:hypothetical protein
MQKHSLCLIASDKNINSFAISGKYYLIVAMQK